VTVGKEEMKEMMSEWRQSEENRVKKFEKKLGEMGGEGEECLMSVMKEVIMKTVK
jgi:hypothetical protein